MYLVFLCYLFIYATAILFLRTLSWEFFTPVSIVNLPLCWLFQVLKLFPVRSLSSLPEKLFRLYSSFELLQTSFHPQLNWDIKALCIWGNDLWLDIIRKSPDYPYIAHSTKTDTDRGGSFAVLFAQDLDAESITLEAPPSGRGGEVLVGFLFKRATGIFVFYVLNSSVKLSRVETQSPEFCRSPKDEHLVLLPASLHLRPILAFILCHLNYDIL